MCHSKDECKQEKYLSLNSASDDAEVLLSNTTEYNPSNIVLLKTVTLLIQQKKCIIAYVFIGR